MTMPSSRKHPSVAAHALAGFTATEAIVAACILVASQVAPAQTQEAPEQKPLGLSGSVGLGVASTASYEGSPNRRTIAGPQLQLSYRSESWGEVALDQRGLVWQALEYGGFNFSLVGAVDPGRKTKDSSIANPVPGDKRLAGMGDIKTSLEGGISVGYGPLRLTALKAQGDKGHRGKHLELGLELPLLSRGPLGLQVGLQASWADSRYMQSYFGVTAKQAAATSFKVFTPKSGLHKIDLSLGAEYALTPECKLQTAVTASRLGGDAKKSPLVSRSSWGTVSAALIYSF